LAAQCSRCGRETDLYVFDTPLCERYDDEMDGSDREPYQHLFSEPTVVLTQQWGVYEADGSSVVRYLGDDKRLYDQRNSDWFRLESA
jgi:hypothetical protein